MEGDGKWWWDEEGGQGERERERRVVYREWCCALSLSLFLSEKLSSGQLRSLNIQPLGGRERPDPRPRAARGKTFSREEEREKDSGDTGRDGTDTGAHGESTIPSFAPSPAELFDRGRRASFRSGGAQRRSRRKEVLSSALNERDQDRARGSSFLPLFSATRLFSALVLFFSSASYLRTLYSLRFSRIPPSFSSPIYLFISRARLSTGNCRRDGGQEGRAV